MRHRLRFIASCWFPVVFPLLAGGAAAGDFDELKIKRQGPFEFAEKPVVTRAGDEVTVRFTTKAFCDVTVAIENSDGRIVRHLASGVLGSNAPAPFRKNALRQEIVWDGKNDQERYVDDKASVVVRVSLGLKPRFERNLLWSPRRRLGYYVPIMRAGKEGVYVYQAEGVDRLCLFDHEGDYVRTVHPFPAGKLPDVLGLKWKLYPHGDRLPFKQGRYQQTLLSSGGENHGLGGRAATAMAVHHDGRIALAHRSLNRLQTDGGTGGRELTGPRVHAMFQARGTNADRKHWPVGPTSAVFSPDGKTLYLTGYVWRHTWDFDAHHGVMKMPFEGDREPTVFAGTMVQGKAGSKNGEFNGATSVAVDGKGRVYVSDYMNDRVQVFASAGKHLKNIAVFKPAQVEIHPKTQDVWVFTWQVQTRNLAKVKKRFEIQPMLTQFGPFEKPAKKASWPLPFPARRNHFQPWWNLPPLVYRGGLDGWTDPPTIWVASGKSSGRRPRADQWDGFNLRLLRPKGDRLVVVREFGDDVARARGRKKYPAWNIQYQMLFVNPKTGHLFFGEPDSGPANKAYNQLIEVDPLTGRPATVDLPFNAEHLCFDLDGRAYLRTTDVVVRYDPSNWREVPWDYGEQLKRVSCGGGGRSADVIGGLRLPSTSPVCFHQGGMAVSAKGHLAVSCALRRRAQPRKRVEQAADHGAKYTPRVFPGRVLSSTSACLHIWDRHGKIVCQDAVPGMPQVDGVGIDAQDAIYIMATPTRVFGGKPYFNKVTETLMKLRPKTGDPPEPTFVSSSRRAVVRLPAEDRPDRPPDVRNGPLGQAWIQGAEWFYGGVGFAGFNGPGCACWRCHFALDYFARSFAPEMDRYRVAVLDTAGNLITRIGQYGNPDDGVPLVGTAGPPNPRPIGGDEVGLFHAGYVATHTDRRLFIADVGNARVVSVRLGYHASESVALKDVPGRRTDP
jgi:hypothetical protein